jgi:hypothetical protein
MVRYSPAFRWLLPSAGLPLLLWGCLSHPGSEPGCGAGRERGVGSGCSGLGQDSLVVDLFSLNAALRLREGGGRLTPRGDSLRVDLDTSLEIGDEVVLPTAKPVRTFSAYAVHERDLHCAGNYRDERALLVLFDDGMEGHCHDTAFAWVPAYPYRKPVPVAYLEGKGFWISAGQVDFAVGKLVIHFDFRADGG